MYTPSRSEFTKLARKFNLIPVYREIIADFDTPVSAFQKLGRVENAFLLESVEGGERLGRYSFLGCDPFLLMTASGNEVNQQGSTGEVTEFNEADPLGVIARLLGRYAPAPVDGLPAFYGGAVGYVGYDAVRYFEKIPRRAASDLRLPDVAFMFTGALLVFDHLKHKIKIVVNVRVDEGGTYEQAIAQIDELINRLRQPLAYRPLSELSSFNRPRFQSNVDQSDFVAMVKKAKEYIKAGDIFQVVLSQRFEKKIKVEPFDIYRVLRTINPSPYMVYLKLNDLVLAGTSPEPLVKVEGSRVITRPIAGTRPRGSTNEEEKRLEQELLSDAKERAEHIMLVDLGRNDLGRVCLAGSVKVEELMAVEKYSHVMHMVSTVGGTLTEDKNAFDALKACFPAGTVSGAPKIRAMEIIDELEPTCRGPYAGIYGYFGFGGNLDCGITIRTITIKGNKAYVQAGAGIVADSVPEKEYEESVNKATALLAAIDMADKAQR